MELRSRNHITETEKNENDDKKYIAPEHLLVYQY